MLEQYLTKSQYKQNCFACSVFNYLKNKQKKLSKIFKILLFTSSITLSSKTDEQRIMRKKYIIIVNIIDKMQM